MRVTLDLDTNTIIVPNTYYKKIDAMNELLANRGGEKLEYTQYIKDAFEKAVASPIKRQMDIPKKRG